MKLLLTSGGVMNPSIHNALVDMLDKLIAESQALCIPTAMYGHPWVGAAGIPRTCLRDRRSNCDPSRRRTC